VQVFVGAERHTAKIGKQRIVRIVRHPVKLGMGVVWA